MQLHVVRQILDHVPIQKNLGQVLHDLVEKAEKWDLAPKPASLWWGRTYKGEERSEVLVATDGLMHKFDKFKILGCGMNRQGKTLDAIEECSQPTRGTSLSA